MRMLPARQEGSRFSPGWKNVFLVLTPILLGAVATAWLAWVVLDQEYRQSLRELMTRELAGLDRELAFIEAEVERLANNPILINALADPRQRQGALPELIGRFSSGIHARAFVLADPAGELTFAHLDPLPNYRGLPNLKETLMTGKTSIHLDGAKGMFFVTTPVRYSKTIQGIVICGFDMGPVLNRHVGIESGRRVVAGGDLLQGAAGQGADAVISVVATRQTPVMMRLGISLEADGVRQFREDSVAFKAVGFVLCLGIGVALAVWLLLARVVARSVALSSVDRFGRGVRRRGAAAVPVSANPGGKSEQSPPESSVPGPSPSEPSPSEPSPSEPSPSEPSPSEPSPSEPSPTESSPTESSPTESSPTESGEKAFYLRLKGMERQLEAQETLLHSLFQVLGDGMWEWDLRGGEMILDPRLRAMFGLEVHGGGIPREKWHGRLHPEEGEVVEGLIQVHLSGAADLYVSEHRMRHEDGRWLWVLERGRISVWDERGTPIRMICAVVDVTERKRRGMTEMEQVRLEPEPSGEVVPVATEAAGIETVGVAGSAAEGSGSRDETDRGVATSWPGFPGVDVVAGLANAGGDESLYRHLLVGFYEQHQTLTHRMRDMWGRSRYDRIGKEVQGIREVLYELGALRLHDQAVALEGVLTSMPRRKESIAHYFMPLCQGLDAWMEVLRRWKGGDGMGERVRGGGHELQKDMGTGQSPETVD
ncbi:MAG: PAS domain-containing protein [Magnetococcales bacterium]|nr:PAS domain-containing protein [Magnetococcales bacterium]MBF0631918.1 PAS domain-containing protein [Magnetococcales bacterium]